MLMKFATGQFHQHFMSSFYACISQKRKKTVKSSVSFALLGSASAKAACKMLVNSTLGCAQQREERLQLTTPHTAMSMESGSSFRNRA